MNEQFRSRFLEGLATISASLYKKSGIKNRDKVSERIDRLQQRYPSIVKFYSVDLENIILNIKHQELKKEELKSKEGVYFWRTSLKMEDEETVWQCNNTIREIESSFRCLKTDLDLYQVELFNRPKFI